MANSGPNLGAFRRIVITSDKINDIKADIDRLFGSTSFIDSYKDLKKDIKSGAKPNTLVIDLSGIGADSVAKKVKDAAIKFGADFKVKNERPLGNVKENEDKFSKFTMKVDQKGDFPYKGIIKRNEKGWQLYDENGEKEANGPFSTIESLLDYYDINKEELVGDYVKNLQEIKMNKSLLHKLIKEEIEKQEAEESTETKKPRKLEKDEIGKFYVVTQPSKAKDNCVHEVTILDLANKIKSGELDESRIMGVYHSRGHANSHSKDLLGEIEKELKELEDTMNEYREFRDKGKNLKDKAKNIIHKYKK